MEDSLTCGKGLAEHSPLPAKLAELISSLAHNLELHVATLDLSDDKAKTERVLYVALAEEFQAAAKKLRGAAGRMADARDLPMARHDVRAMANPALGEAFARYVKLEEELLGLLRHDLERDQAMLAAMRGGHR